MKVVNQFEDNLIRILRAIVGHGTCDSVQALLLREKPRPNCLGRDCITIVQHDLSNGLVETLSRWGWAKERYLSGETSISGRLWERTDHSLRQLAFSSHTLEWLIWLTSTNFSQPAWLPPRPSPASPLLLGDRLFLLVLLSKLKETLTLPVLVKHPAVRNDGLLWLMFFDKFAQVSGAYRGDFSFWMSDKTSWILEACQTQLAKRWSLIENAKQKIRSPEEMRRLGEIQSRVLTEFLSSIDAHQRRDLSRFLLVAVDNILHNQASNRDWYESLNLADLRIADRAETYQAALCFLNGLKQLQQWQQSALATTFYDDNYQESQFWKSEWERLQGDRVCEEASRVGKQFELLSRVSG